MPNASTRMHFLHPGKTGGSAVKAALAPIAAEFGLVLHPHTIVLTDIPEHDRFFFLVRDPVTRFISGFNSRLRQGQPRLNVTWNKAERIAFERFGTPNALAEALLSAEENVVNAAREAMRGIRHVNSSYLDWFVDEPYLRSRFRGLVFVGLQEELEADFERLKRLLALPTDIALPSDEIAAHRTPPGFQTGLSALGRKNIVRWYARDIQFYRFACQLRIRALERFG